MVVSLGKSHKWLGLAISNKDWQTIEKYADQQGLPLAMVVQEMVAMGAEAIRHGKQKGRGRKEG